MVTLAQLNNLSRLITTIDRGDLPGCMDREQLKWKPNENVGQYRDGTIEIPDDENENEIYKTQRTNYKCVADPVQSTKTYLNPLSSLPFRYTFVFKVIRRADVVKNDYCVLDLICYTRAWLDDYAEDSQTDLAFIGTCALLKSIFERWNSKQTLTPQTVTFLIDLNTEKLSRHAKERKIHTNVGFIPVFDEYVTYIPVPADRQTIDEQGLVAKNYSLEDVLGNRQLVTDALDRPIGLTANRGHFRPDYDTSVFTEVQTDTVNPARDSGSITSTVKLTLQDTDIANCFIPPFGDTVSVVIYCNLLDEWMNMVRVRYFEKTPEIMVFLTNTNDKITGNRLLRVKYVSARERAELSFDNRPGKATWVNNADEWSVTLTRCIQFTNELRSCLEYIMRSDMGKVIYKLDYTECHAPDYRFETNRMASEIDMRALIENASIIRLVNYKSFCLIPDGPISGRTKLTETSLENLKATHGEHANRKKFFLT